MGESTSASGDYSTAMNRSTIASGAESTAMGFSSTASGALSVAMGFNTQAIGQSSFTVGSSNVAYGNSSIAMGSSTSASGFASTAMGYYTYAGGNASTAMGEGTSASGNYSTAMGVYVSTNGKDGSFIIGDDNGGHFTTHNTDSNQMMMRFANGYVLYTNDSTTIGVQVGAGGNSWSVISDRRRKENFSAVNGEDFLKKIDNFNLTSWNYKGQDARTFRHYGPMAQDFYAAFGKDSYGSIGNDTTINQADFEGVSFIAIQALERRTQEQTDKINELEKKVNALSTENAVLKGKADKVASLTERLDALEASLNEKDKAVTVK